MKAACTGCGAAIDPSPSKVTIDLPCVSAIVARQDRDGRPSTSTLQAPHWPSPHPNLVAVRPRPRKPGRNSRKPPPHSCCGTRDVGLIAAAKLTYLRSSFSSQIGPNGHAPVHSGFILAVLITFAHLSI